MISRRNFIKTLISTIGYLVFPLSFLPSQPKTIITNNESNFNKFSLAKLDELIDSVEQPKYLYMNKQTVAELRKLKSKYHEYMIKSLTEKNELLCSIPFEEARPNNNDK